MKIDSLEASVLPEVRAAALWWANLLSGPVTSHSTNPYADALKNIASANKRELSEVTISAFYGALCLTIGALVAQTDWRVEEPTFGSALRTVHNDYSPHETIEAAASKAGLRDIYDRMPWKTIMWINPGLVTVSQGRGAPSIIIYPNSQEQPK